MFLKNPCWRRKRRSLGDQHNRSKVAGVSGKKELSSGGQQEGRAAGHGAPGQAVYSLPPGKGLSDGASFLDSDSLKF